MLLKKAENTQVWWNSSIDIEIIACRSHAVCFGRLLGEHSIMERFTCGVFALRALVNVWVLMGLATVDSLKGLRGTSNALVDQIKPQCWHAAKHSATESSARRSAIRHACRTYSSVKTSTTADLTHSICAYKTDSNRHVPLEMNEIYFNVNWSSALLKIIIQNQMNYIPCLLRICRNILCSSRSLIGPHFKDTKMGV